MTTFCLVHGAWHDDACWAPLVALLEARGHQCITPVLPLEDDDAGFERLREGRRRLPERM